MSTVVKGTAGAGIGATLMAMVMGVAVPNIQKAEGLKNVPYYDQVRVLTVCAGHTGPDVVVNHFYTNQKCAQLTEQDAEKAASGVLKVSPQLIYHPYILASAVSFSYNVGVGSYDRSSVARDFNAGNYIKGCHDLMKYVMAGGNYDQGLYNRRVRETALCLSTLTPGGLVNVPASTS